MANNIKPLNDEMLTSIKEHLRQNFEEIDAESLAEKTKERLFANNSWDEFEGVSSNKSIARYMEQCARVTWHMVIQQTPMYLSTSDTRFDDVIHKLWWSCDQSEAQKINYFVWPSLYDFKNGSLMVKGCVHAC